MGRADLMRLALAFCLTMALDVLLTLVSSSVILMVVFATQGVFRDGMDGAQAAELMRDEGLHLALQLGVGLPCTFLAAWIGARVARRAERLMPPLAFLTLSLASFLWSNSPVEPLKDTLLLVISLLAALAGGALARRGRLKREAAKARSLAAQF
ncbi:hypothetical protein [Stagnihabitans tardus]|uniref:Uncharacterized protein n=1 Tax=Stagnihabitans tardus TaxID=2699202 RepID=A0AAE4YA34_9RHOB|nr:hypothetical protein [Stagnihabitans tardus]NBZ87503.1 hypothetical protein [Stagnihabitans tardus]